MGLFSKLKKLTGGWADVSVMSEGAVRGEPAEVSVQVSVKDEPIQINRVYVNLKCVEEIRIPNYRVKESGSNNTSTQIDVRKSETHHEREFTAAGATKLDANAFDTLPVTVDIPAHLPPSFEGKYFRIRWMVKAGLDMSGNDPDSGWQDLIVK